MKKVYCSQCIYIDKEDTYSLNYLKCLCPSNKKYRVFSDTWYSLDKREMYACERNEKNNCKCYKEKKDVLDKMDNAVWEILK